MKLLFLSYESSYKILLQNWPDTFRPLYFGGPTKSRKIPAKCPTRLPCKKTRRIHRRACVGARWGGLNRKEGVCKDGGVSSWGGGGVQVAP